MGEMKRCTQQTNKKITKDTSKSAFTIDVGVIEVGDVQENIWDVEGKRRSRGAMNDKLK